MLMKLKENLLYIGIIVFFLTFLIEHIFPFDTEITSFLKGIGCGIIVGAVIQKITKKKTINNSRAKNAIT
jgi:hypothetical protein